MRNPFSRDEKVLKNENFVRFADSLITKALAEENVNGVDVLSAGIREGLINTNFHSSACCQDCVCKKKKMQFPVRCAEKSELFNKATILKSS